MHAYTRQIHGSLRQNFGIEAEKKIKNHGMAALRFRIRPPSCGFALLHAGKAPTVLNKTLEVDSHHARCIHRYPSPHAQHRNSDYGRQKSLYDTLGLPPFSSPSEIKRKYYELSKLHHPDRNQGDPTANDRFVEISHAYRILSSSVSKTSYDSSLKVSHSKSDRRHHGQRGPVGGREAGGLSKRPVSPQGPPPSYYRDRPIKLDDQTSTPRSSRFNWDEKYRQHYIYQERFRKGSGAYKPIGKTNYSDVSDFCLRAVAVGTCILLVGVLGRWLVTEISPDYDDRV
ncbi:DnaJ domain protein [Orbilia oligospora]|uniref:DnaJ domain protein n=2 Tax=Orbilia oligospora TaxID=2813651 RepID=A0A7C8J765_ORBOL|nr:DnaJ domain protein [Orbilia oligospora]KAF3084778.1 DnaJ domain protein [Orbilia oligospora]KAF3093645.1 DnaJ domain protein [Orbilia oligospora]KAF3149442.1 DnaJ domain protein [Orbilia oligospora]